MKSNTGVIIGAILIVLVIIGAVFYKNNKKPDNAGILYVGITDATADISEVNDLDLSVKKIEIQSNSGVWTEVSSVEKSYKLLSLNASGKTELYVKADVSAGEYGKIRMTLGDAIVKTKSKGDMKATLPSAYVVIENPIKIKENASTNVELDILADKSLHTTSDGAYVFAPVVKVESHSNAQISVGEDNTVSVVSGDLNGSTTVGVDLNGKSRTDFILRTGSTLKMESSETGKVKFYLGGEMYEESDITEEDSSKIDGSRDNKDDRFEIDFKNPIDEKVISGDGSLDINLNGSVDFR